MAALIVQPPTLEAFLKLLETKPASEYINGEVIQKPTPKGQLSRTKTQQNAWKSSTLLSLHNS